MMTALCKLDGYLVLMSTTKAVSGQGHCPVCYGVKFQDAPYGWVECITDGGCGFVILKEHLIPDDVNNMIGAYI